MFSEIFPFVLLLCSVSASGRFGDINKVQTSGASCRTAKQDKLTICGVQASETMAQTDLTRMNRYKSIIQSVSQKKGMDAALIAGIISRESRAGNVLVNGWGDHGNAFGLMQVDKRFHTVTGAWNSEEHVTQGTDILIGMFDSIRRKFPTWSTEQHLKGAIAAYNAGPGNVISLDVDTRTTGKDYANDVVARAKFYKKRGY
ncbi:lysozyme G-like 2 S homeolog precursor [Xenopus laevis]|nr:lysozyme G-like 2 S homeolog precursor [Xenopus laevis]AAH83046.1 LOC494860 protein [Xenopus laevis]